jgi:hypothetical protein
MSQNSKPTLYLYGAMSKPQITLLVRGQCIPEELNNLQKILEGWENASNVFRKIEAHEKGMADNNQPIKMDSNPKLDEIQNDPLFKNGFSSYPSDFATVEIDKLIAVQRQVSLPYIDQLTNRIPKNPSLNNLIDICLSPKQNVPSSQSYQLAENVYNFSSPSVDFRFLGGFPKALTEDDLKYCLAGGLPVGAVILFYGYGTGSINVLKANNRLILNNGFHRVYALRKLGITKIPVVVQHIGNPDLEMMPQILGLTKEYLLNHPRPVLVKDFFTNELTTTLRLKNTIRSVRVQWGFEQTDMAI